MAEVTLLDAVRMALSRALEEDENVVLLGEDIGVNGGVFRATEDFGINIKYGSSSSLS